MYRLAKINFSILVSIGLSFPHGYYRIYKTDVNGTGPGFCDNSEVVKSEKIGTINLDQFILLYTIIFAYILPLSSILLCYSIMIKRLSKEKKLVITWGGVLLIHFFLIFF